MPGFKRIPEPGESSCWHGAGKILGFMALVVIQLL